MKFKVSSSIIDLFDHSKKNPNYMLDYLLSSIDSHNCKAYFQILKAMDFDAPKREIALSDSNITSIQTLWGYINDELVERLLWISVLLQEV
jgi:hypothetical protein